MASRMVMLGLDGVDWPSIKEWAAQGRLPILGQLLAESRVVDFEQANRLVPGSVWPDIATGVSVAKHGYIVQAQQRPDSYRCEASFHPERLPVPPFYKSLSDSGLRCAVVDFPMSRPYEDFNGIQVVDWAPDFSPSGFETMPREFASKMAAYGRHPLTGSPRNKLDVGSLLALKHQMIEGTRIKQQLALDLIKQREHDFVLVVFCELHKAGHFLWHFQDRTHPDFSQAQPELVDSLLHCYEELDHALGSIVESLSGDDDLVIFADRGMGPNYRGDHLVDDVLVALELAVPRAKTTQQKRRFRVMPSGLGARKVYKYVADRLPDSVREALLPLHRAAIGEAPPLDWKRTRVFRTPTVTTHTYLRINLAGREPEGIVMPAEYEGLLAEVATQFGALVHPETGEPLVEEVSFPAKNFAGPQAAILPDITIAWSTRGPINGASSADVGVIRGTPPLERSGNHRPPGFALFRGPTFAASGGEEPGDARQIAPAVLQRFGVSIPSHYDLPPPQAIWRRGSTGTRARVA
jgi:predicted AlkP superfamily phosphohydrolase/phosphomutase